MQKILNQYRFFIALLGLLAMGFSYIHYSQNQDVISVFQTEKVEFEEADLEGLANEQTSLAFIVIGVLIFAVLDAPFNLIFRRLKSQFIEQISKALRSVGFFIRFHQIKIGY